MSKEHGFPQYRKYRNNLSWFRIHSPDRFDEIRFFSGKYFLYEFTAKILPDRNLVQDLLYHYYEYCEEITEAEFGEVLKKVTP